MSEVLRLEQQQSDAKVLIEHRKLALKLYENPAFKKLILEEFCVQECARYAQASGDFALSAENRADALAFAQAAGHIRKWLSVKVQQGFAAERDSEELDAALDAARAEADAEAEEAAK